MEEILEEFLQNNNKQKFYKQFACLKIQDINKEFIGKIWELIEKNILSKNILYLSLLLHKNNDLLAKCISLDKETLNIENSLKDPILLFDYTFHTKKHWFYNLIKNKNGFDYLPQLAYLQLINLTNNEFHLNNNLEEFIEKNCQDIIPIDKFWIYYAQEIKYILNILNILNITANNMDILNYASQNSMLELASEYLELDQTNVQVLLQKLPSKSIPHKEDYDEQLIILTSYTILAKLLKIIIKNDNINVNEILTQIQSELLNIKEHSLQLQLLQVIFSCIFLKTSHINNNSISKYICNEKELRIILFALKNVIEEIKFKKIYNRDNLEKLNDLFKMVTDASWRLELIINVVEIKKYEENLLKYLLAEPESLINLCLKNNGDFNRASQVLQIFSLETSPIANEIIYTEKLQELKEIFKKTSKIRDIQETTPDLTKSHIKLNFDDIAEEFFKKHPSNKCEESDKIIEENLECYPFLDHFKSDNELVMNILDLAITQTSRFDDSRALLHLASNYNTLSNKESDFSTFSRQLLIIFNEIGEKLNVTLGNILLNPDIPLNKNKWQKQEEFYENLQKIYDEFNSSLLTNEEGVLNKDHLSHKICQHLFNFLLEDNNEKYLQKLFNYLKAFSKVLYIEKDTSTLISNGKNTSFFNLLTFNRSELMGKLLFEQNLDPKEFEKYFQKLKLDFLYHVTGNCFPTINLYTNENVAKDELYPENLLYAPNGAVITYINKRHWLLALILIEMYKIEDVQIAEVGESRIKHFINYLRLPKIQNLQALFKYNEIIAALQNDINYNNIHEYVYEEIKKNDFGSSTQTNHSNDSLETAEEILEDGLKTTNWRKLFSIVDSITEKQLKKEPEFQNLRDMILVNLIKDAFECEYYKFILEISDGNLRVNLLLENMKTWPVDFCINSIKSELTRFEEIEEETEIVEELKLWLKHIEHSKKVMRALEVTSWAIMYDLCTFQPREVLNKLLMSKNINLLIEFIELHEVSQAMLLCIDEQFLESAFDIHVDVIFIEKLLKFLPKDYAIKVCQKLLNMLKHVQHLQFICNYLMEHTKEAGLRNIALSLKMLSVFTHSEFDQQLLVLLRDPMSIIEVLIMNTKLDKLAAVLEIIKNSIPTTECNEEIVTVEKIDDLLRIYAEKSLDFRIIAQPEPRLLSTPEHKLLQSLDSINLDPAAKVFIMPDEVPTKDQWVANSEVIECMCCTNVFFSMFNRRHHCRRCGRVVCYNCSKKRMIVPTYGDILVRVCSDCFKQTFNNVSASEDTTSTKSALDDYWMLTNDAEHNRIVREEFSYELAPSVSLCLSLMKFHSVTSEENAKFLLDQCDILLKLLIPNQDPLQEIDYMLVIRMLKSLALAAKMASHDTSLHVGSSSADRILTQAELLSLLAERGCLSLLPASNSAFIDSISLMRLIDKLLEREQWQLALEVSTKTGIDKSGVFIAWGISCLKAGSLISAREKFSKCFDKNTPYDPSYYDIDSSSLKVIRNPPVLNEIIKILESKKETIDEDVLFDYQKISGSTSTLSQSVISASPVDGAMFILNKLKNLKHIEMGYYATGKKRREKLDEIIYDECIYYLSKYGTGISLVEFHIKYGNFHKALNCIIKKNLSPDVFVEIYMNCLKEGTVNILQTHMSELDSTLIIWKDHLMQICCHLAKRNFLHSLYQLQLYMGDYVRAAMTCFRFYQEKAICFTDLLKNSHFLIKSQEHLRQAKEQEQWITVSTVHTVESEQTFDVTSVESPLIKKMTNEEIEKHTATILMQIEVTEFLSECEKNGVMPMQVYLEIFPNPDNIPKHKINIPTLFGSSDHRKYLSVLCIICSKSIEEGFSIGLGIINEFKLKPILVYKETGKYLAQTEKCSDIIELVNFIKQSTGGSDEIVEVCDEMLISAVATLKNRNSSDANVEELIKHITDKTMKISAYIEAKQLKTAYFLATKYKRVMDLKRIMREAEILNQNAIKVLCQKAIQRYSTENQLV